jgi:hypothetical protein
MKTLIFFFFLSYLNFFLIFFSIKSWFHQYSLSLFWGLGVMVTIVWYIPVNHVEVVFSIGVILVAIVVFGYSVSTIGMILT